MILSVLLKHQRFFFKSKNLKVRRSLFQQCIVFHRMWLSWPNHRTHLEFGCLNFNFSIMEAIQISEKVKKQVQSDRSVYRFDVCFCLLLIYFAKHLAISPLVRTSWPEMTGRKENAESGARPIRTLHYSGLANQKPGIAATGWQTTPRRAAEISACGAGDRVTNNRCGMRA